jgi:exodeoxyribonuclease III
MPITVASWNVNSIRVRFSLLCTWLETQKPDIICLQELKAQNPDVPQAELRALGYEIALVGQKTYNGVAVLSRFPITLRHSALPGDEDDKEARYLEIETADFIIAALYAPNGNPLTGLKFPYKIAWLARLEAHAKALLALERKVILAGDFNIIPQAIDCWDEKAWLDDALYHPQSRAAWWRLTHQGWVDALRCVDECPQNYTFWDYQQGRWPRDEGIRIDHLLLSPHAADSLENCWIDKTPRAEPKPSDHTPILAAFKA